MSRLCAGFLVLSCLVLAGCANTMAGYAEDRQETGERVVESFALISDSVADALGRLNDD